MSKEEGDRQNAQCFYNLSLYRHKALLEQRCLLASRDEEGETGYHLCVVTEGSFQNSGAESDVSPDASYRMSSIYRGHGYATPDSHDTQVLLPHNSPDQTAISSQWRGQGHGLSETLSHN